MTPHCPTGSPQKWMNHKGIYWAPIKNLGNNLGKTGYIQNMFYCLKIKNLQEKFLRFFFFVLVGNRLLPGPTHPPQFENSN